MTTRDTLDVVWASGTSAEVTDPNTDTTHPIYTSNKYATGWTFDLDIYTNNKQPHQWRNYFVNNATGLLRELAEQGSLTWQPALQYKVGALVAEGGINYVALKANSNTSPIGNPSVWSTDTYRNYPKEVWDAQQAEFNAIFQEHAVGVDNPHAVGANQFAHGGGYTKEQILMLLSEVTTTLSGHKAKESNPHNLTTAQTNTLSAATGGTFQGQVDIDGGVTLGSKKLDWLSGAFVIEDGNSDVGVDAGGEPVVNRTSSGKSRTRILNEFNYHPIRNTEEVVYALPEPLIHFPLYTDLRLEEGTGYPTYEKHTSLSYVDRTGTPSIAGFDIAGFGIQGLAWSEDTKLSTSPVSNCTVVFKADGVLVVVELTSWSGKVEEVVPTNTKYVQDFRVFPTLSNKQKLMLA